MVQNVNKLKAKMVEQGYTSRTLSYEIGVCETTLRTKINGKSDFTLNESLKIKEILHLSTDDYLDIFFGTKLEFNS